VFVRAQHILSSSEGADEHQQSPIGEGGSLSDGIDDAKFVAGVDEDVSLTAARLMVASGEIDAAYSKVRTDVVPTAMMRRFCARAAIDRCGGFRRDRIAFAVEACGLRPRSAWTRLKCPQADVQGDLCNPDPALSQIRKNLWREVAGQRWGRPPIRARGRKRSDSVRGRQERRHAKCSGGKGTWPSVSISAKRSGTDRSEGCARRTRRGR